MKNTQKSNSSHTTAVRFQRSALAAACVVAIGGFGVSGAQAQTMTYGMTFSPFAHLLLPGLTVTPQFVANSQINTAPQTGTITNTGVGATLVTSSGASPVTVSGNASRALAIGNQVNANSIPLINLPTPTGFVGILSGQLHTSTATATQTSVTFGVVESGQQAAPITVIGNAISASTTLNQAVSKIEGAVPVGYTSTTQASVTANYVPTGITSTTVGSVGISSHQTALNGAARAGSRASIDTTEITIDLQATTPAFPLTPATASSQLTLTGNSISTAFGANDATNTFSATGTVSPTFQGSVAVNNIQANIENTGAGTLPTSGITGSSITADITNRVPGVTTTLTAALEVSGNALDAKSTGNAAGNAIGFGPNLSFAGTAPVVGVNALSNAASLPSGSVAAGVVLANGQANQGTRLESVITGGIVSAKADTMAAAGSISAIGNAVGTAATGNFARNLIAANGTSFVSTVAAASSQGNIATPILATNNLGAITVGVGQVVSASPVTGSITLNGNTLDAVAQGNDAATAVVIDSTSLTIVRPLSAVSSATADTSGLGAVNTASGASANNLQGNYGDSILIPITVTAQVTNGRIAVNVVDQANSTAARVALSAASVTLDENVIDASATGNFANTSVTLKATNSTAQASVGNTQVNANRISGVVADSGVTLTSGGVSASLLSSSLTLTNNTVSASATANNAVNAVSASATNLTTGPSSMTAVVNAVTIVGDVAQSNANFGIASGQRNTASVSATNLNPLGGSSAVISVGSAGTGGVSGNSALTASNNSVTADTTGNRVVNTLAIGATNLDTAGNAATQIGGISSLQDNVVDGVANAAVGGSTSAVTRVGIEYAVSLDASNLTVSGNAAASTSLGNRANNLLSAAGVLLSSAAPTVASGLTSSTGTFTIQNEFALLNRQLDSVTNGRNANTIGVTVGISDAGTLASAGVSGSNLTVSANSITAEARNNNASNEVNLTGFSMLSSGAGLLNQQASITNVGAAATEGSVRIRALDTAVTNSSLTMDSNVVQARAVGSSAGNSVNVQATNLSGNANLAVSGIPTNPSGVLSAQADYNLVSEQYQQGSVNAQASTPVRIMLGGSAVTGGNLTLSNNVVRAIAQATSAVNGLSLSGTNVTNITGELASLQTTAASVTATLTPEPIGMLFGLGTVAIDALSMSGTPVVVEGNQQLASAGQNYAINAQTLVGTSIAGKPLTAGFEFLTDNVQIANGTVTATSQPGHIGVLVGSVNGGSLVVSGNGAAANANANTGTNSLALTATSMLSANGLVNNEQNSSLGAVSASVSTTAVGVVSTGLLGLVSSPVTVSDNTLDAKASRNIATNSLTAKATTLNGSVTTGLDFSVISIQNGTGDVTGSNTLGLIGARANLADSTSLTVKGNKASSSANVNFADNALTLNAISALNGTAQISNTQNALGGLVTPTQVSATTGGTSTAQAMVGVAMSSATGLAFNASPVTVSGNRLSAQGGGNTALNALEAIAVGSIAGSTNPTFAVLNTQNNFASITTTVQFANIGLTTAPGATLSNTNATVHSNNVVAYSYGNSASNSIGLSALSSGQNLASASVSNTQLNSASVSSIVNGVNIGVFAGGASGGSSTITGNTITAQAIGNSASNVILAR